MPLVLRKTTNNPQSRFSAPVTQEWRQDWHRILLVAHSCYRSLSRRSPAPLCHLTEPPVASNSCALSLFLEGGGQVTSYRTISPHGQRTVAEGCFELYFSFLLFALISKLALYPPCIPKRTIDQGK